MLIFMILSMSDIFFFFFLNSGKGFIQLRGVPHERRKPVNEPNWVIVTIFRTVGTPSLCDLRLLMG